MEALHRITLAKAADKFAKGARLGPGTYGVDWQARLRVAGEVTRDPDTDKRPTCTLLSRTAVALALHYAGVSRRRAKEVLARAVADALEKGGSSAAAIADRLADVDAALAHVDEIVDRLPRTPVQGATRCNLLLEAELLSE